ncbi:MAG: hypothetical protein FWG09_01970 [Synergistaceae bacterium]|nr:hypothetical protein [Synergistaceae bacterium]
MEPVKDDELKSILTPELFDLWASVVAKIDAVHGAGKMEKEWDKGGKAAKYALRFRRGGKLSFHNLFNGA